MFHRHSLVAERNQRRKARTVFTDKQLKGLEKQFEVKRYLSTSERNSLACYLQLTDTQVKDQISNGDKYITIKA